VPAWGRAGGGSKTCPWQTGGLELLDCQSQRRTPAAPIDLFQIMKIKLQFMHYGFYYEVLHKRASLASAWLNI